MTFNRCYRCMECKRAWASTGGTVSCTCGSIYVTWLNYGDTFGRLTLAELKARTPGPGALAPVSSTSG